MSEQAVIYDAILANAGSLADSNGAPQRAEPAQPQPEQDGDGVEITFVRRKHRLQIDMDALTWQDATELQGLQARAQAGEISEGEATEVMNAMLAKVLGQDPMKMPATLVTRASHAMLAELNKAGAQGN